MVPTYEVQVYVKEWCNTLEGISVLFYYIYYMYKFSYIGVQYDRNLQAIALCMVAVLRMLLSAYAYIWRRT